MLLRGAAVVAEKVHERVPGRRVNKKSLKFSNFYFPATSNAILSGQFQLQTDILRQIETGCFH